MRFFSSPIAFLCVFALDYAVARVCTDRFDEPCVHPNESIATVTPGSHYIAKLPCRDCLVTRPIQTGREKSDWSLYTLAGESDLFFNISLSHDRRTLLLNSRKLYPDLWQHPNEPYPFPVSQISTNITRTKLQLKASAGCDQGQCTHTCKFSEEDCTQLPYWASSGDLDYDYGVEQHSTGADGTAAWNITFDALGLKGAWGGSWPLNQSEQQVLTIVVNGKQLKQEEDTVSNPQAGSTLFGSFGKPKKHEAVYELEIADVQLIQRPQGHMIPGPLKHTTLSQKIKHFFGIESPRPNHHIVYLREEWGWYGARRGTLKEKWEEFKSFWDWSFFFMIAGYVLLGIVSLYLVYRLFFWILEQRRLARWSGIDEVWRVLREDRDEEDGLLHSGYRDEPEDIPPPPYTDEPRAGVNKPLPSLPSSNKPLPAIPQVEIL